MILSGKEIKNRMSKGDICIRPFDDDRLNPNSYNLRLHNELIVYDESTLDMAKDNAYHTIKIPPEGLVLEPGKLYLGRTMEFTETKNLVPMLEGRSSIGRLGIYIHVTAGFGDIGFAGCWTLEIQCVQPVRIYPFVDICQIYYHTIEGEYEPYSSKGKYQGATGIQTSQIWKELGGKPNPLNEPFTLSAKEINDMLLEDAIKMHDPLKPIWQEELHNAAMLAVANLQKAFAPWNAVIVGEKLVNPCDDCDDGFEYVVDENVHECCREGCKLFVDYNKAIDQAEATDEDPHVLYLCDRRACDTCGPTCKHTSNIKHAVGFVVDEHGQYWQKIGD